MHRTSALQRMVSTRHGQRRILKRPPPILEYIERAVDAGTYRTNEEIAAAKDDISKGMQPRVAMSRIRRDVIRGTQVQDYPPEYHILKSHPPIPPPPRVPKKYLRGMQDRMPKHPAEKLIKKYLQRQSKPVASTEEYYQRLLGVNPPPENYAMGQKSAKVSQAYAFAVKQYEVMRTQDVSESEALAIVDKLLAEEKRDEGFKSRKFTQDMTEWTGKARTSQAKEPSTSGEDDAVDEVIHGIRKQDLPSILHNKPRVVQGMIQWSRMLQGTNYNEWTVGASTALDHWIARNILELSEETWDALLEGTDPSLMSRGQDIVTVRETLFPETRLEPTPRENYDELIEKEQRELEMAAMEVEEAEPAEQPAQPVRKQRTVDELLSSLRGMGRDDDERDTKSPSALASPIPDLKQHEAQDESKNQPKTDVKKDPIQRLTDELQDWRAKNQTIAYERWSPNEKEQFSVWLQRYIRTLISEADWPLIDMEETRIALLSNVPRTEEQSDDFWSNLQDETKADLFLQNLVQNGPPEGLSDAEKEFWNLPYAEQHEKLMNLGAVRPFMDEYMSDEEREEFFHRYGDLLLDGVEMDHLVDDPNGPITASDLGMEAVRKWGIGREERFKLQKLPYRALLTGDPEVNKAEEGKSGSEMALDRSRALYEAWNRHKASRARYEEQMFVQGDLGVTYKSKTRNELEREQLEQELKVLPKDKPED